ncbi:roadblock/LC7 domain-containing protein [Streptomyces mirabilis]|uniref:roadblock/LC7 domain-containing protein n=1 Tax=Streptomyces mirabilis TaxID=68239 RepID=UPI0037F4095F
MTEAMITPHRVDALEWLFDGLLGVQGVVGAVLASQDGLRMSYTHRTRSPADKGFDEATADRLAGVISGLYGLANGVAVLNGGSGRDLRQSMIQHGDWSLFVVSAGKGVPSEMARGLGAHPTEVEGALGVLTSPHVDEGAVGYEMVQLVKRMGRHMQAPARRSDSDTSNGQ